MKNSIRKIAIVIGFLLAAFSQQAFTPPLPPTTTICVDGLPSCYAVRVVVPDYYDEAVQTSPRTREWLIMGYQYSYENGDHHYTIEVSTKAYSYSSWIYRGYIYSDDPSVDWNNVDDYLYFIDIDYDQLTMPPPEPE